MGGTRMGRKYGGRALVTRAVKLFGENQVVRWGE